MLELLAAYLVLGGLTALARGRWRIAELARTTLIWPVMLPELLRRDPAPEDPPQLRAWARRIGDAAASLETAIEQGRLLGNEEAGRQLLVDTRADLEGVARRHAELDALLQQEPYDLELARLELQIARQEAEGAARVPALQSRVAQLERLHQVRSALEGRLEEGMAQLMNLAARLHLAHATGAPVQALSTRLQELANAVGGVEEVEALGGLELEEIAPGTWQASEAAPDAEAARQAEAAPGKPFAEPLDREQEAAARRAFEQALNPPQAELPAVRPSPPPGPGQVGGGDTQSARITMVAFILALTLGSLFYRILGTGGLEQSSALFIGLPALLAMVVALLPSGRSATGIILKIITLMLLVSGIALAEGLICILMAAPVFYAIGIAAGIALDLLNSQSRARRMAVLAPLALLSLEGVHPAFDLPRAEHVTRSRVVAGTPADVAAGLAAQPDFSTPLPFLLRVGFPRPVRTFGHGLRPGDRRVVHFAGGEGHPGDLLLEVTEADHTHVRFDALSDDSHIAHWLRWRYVTVHWEAVGEGRTAVSWTLAYDRELDPALWFGPVERAAVGLTADYLMTSLLPPEVDDAAP